MLFATEIDRPKKTPQSGEYVWITFFPTIQQEKSQANRKQIVEGYIPNKSGWSIRIMY